METLTLSELVELKSKLMKPATLATDVELEAIKNVEEEIASFPNTKYKREVLPLWQEPAKRLPLESDLCSCVFCNYFIKKEEEISDEEKSQILRDIELEKMDEWERYFYDIEADRDFEPTSEVQFSE
jgi:hypothetical protein